MIKRTDPHGDADFSGVDPGLAESTEPITRRLHAGLHPRLVRLVLAPVLLGFAGCSADDPGPAVPPLPAELSADPEIVAITKSGKPPPEVRERILAKLQERRRSAAVSKSQQIKSQALSK